MSVFWLKKKSTPAQISVMILNKLLLIIILPHFLVPLKKTVLQQVGLVQGDFGLYQTVLSGWWGSGTAAQSYGAPSLQVPRAMNGPWAAWAGGLELDKL